MMKVEVLDDGVVVLSPEGKLSADDFAAIAGVVDPVIEARGTIPGLVIEAERFPGWEDFAALRSHLRFVRDHHRAIERVAIASDAPAASLAPLLADHFVKAEVRHFSHAASTTARLWVAHKI